MLEALTALFAILLFYTVLSICGLIQFVAQRHRARRSPKKAAGQQVF
jgi:hypothetical protein